MLEATRGKKLGKREKVGSNKRKKTRKTRSLKQQEEKKWENDNKLEVQ